MNTSETNKNELILKVDFSSLETLDKFIDFLNANNINIKGIGNDEFLVSV